MVTKSLASYCEARLQNLNAKKSKPEICVLFDETLVERMTSALGTLDIGKT